MFSMYLDVGVTFDSAAFFDNCFSNTSNLTLKVVG